LVTHLEISGIYRPIFVTVRFWSQTFLSCSIVVDISSIFERSLKSYELFFLRMKIKMTQVNLASMAALIRQTKKPFSAESSQAALIILGFDDSTSSSIFD